MNQRNYLSKQLAPISLTILTFLLLSAVLLVYVKLLNLLPMNNIYGFANVKDVVIGVFIYVKTAIDFALFTANLMANNKGFKNQIAIELGTQAGNGIGTLLILTIWYFFKQVPVLLLLMIILASIVLLRLAEEGFESFLQHPDSYKHMQPLAKLIEQLLAKINLFFAPLTKIILPENISSAPRKTILSLAIFSFTVPFILGLDDFAGYIPLFSLVNVVSFSIGVFLGHMLLLTFLFVSPARTEKVVRHPLIIIGGGVAFIAISLFGFTEALKLLFQLL